MTRHNHHTSIAQQEVKSFFNAHQKTATAIRHSSAADRCNKLQSIIDYLSDRNHEAKLAEAMQKDLGKHLVEVLATEVTVIISIAKYIQRHLSLWMQDEKRSTSLPLLGASSYIKKEPKGCTLIIAPWNYPLQLSLGPLCYAIAAGCTAVIKPSEFAIATSAFLKDMIVELFDPNEITVVQGEVPETQMLLDQPWNHIYFTGSPQVGKIIMKAASQHLSSVTLELGGKSPCVVDRNINIQRAADKMAWSKYLNNGQTCIALDYVLVHVDDEKKVADHLMNSIVKLFGDDTAHNPDYGRIISLKHHRRCQEILQDALDKGAKLVTGGSFDEETRYFAPTVLGHVTQDMKVMQEEIFGPILPIVTYRDMTEVTHIINQKPKPLALYILSKSKKNIKYIMNHTSAGGTVINDFMIHYANPNIPFGGVNNSGMGKTHGYFGFQEFTNERAVMHQRWGLTNLLYPPYTKTTERLIRFMGKWLS